MTNFLKPAQTFCNFARNLGWGRGRNPYYWNDGIKYPGFTYYPRTPDFKDPPYEPTKLFRVQRIKSIKGTSYWEKNVLRDLGLLGKKQSEINIVKNIPENNARMYKVKHLIKITPITFPDGFPEDSNGTYLKENGELKVAKRVGFDKRLTACEEFRQDPKRMDGDTLRRELRKRWLSGW